MYKIRIKRSAQKDLDDFDDKTYIRIDAKILNLKDNPFPREAKKLKGGRNRYRIRQGDYRILYDINKKDKIILIYRIKRRSRVYRGFVYSS